MKRNILCAALLLFLVPFLVACAAGPSKTKYPFSVKGFGTAAERDSSNVKNSIGGGLGGTFRFMEHFSVEGNISRSSTEWNLVNDSTDEDATVDETIYNLFLRWHITTDTALMPYIGAGPNYVTYTNEDPHSDSILLSADLDDESGWTGVIGAETHLGTVDTVEEEWDNWYFYGEVWRMYNEVNQDSGASGTLVELDDANDSWIFVLGISKRF